MAFRTDAQLDTTWFNNGVGQATPDDALLERVEFKGIHDNLRRTIYSANFTTDRNSVYASAPVGTRVLVENNGIIYRKIGTGSTNSSWTASRLTVPATGLTESQLNSAYKLIPAAGAGSGDIQDRAIISGKAAANSIRVGNIHPEVIGSTRIRSDGPHLMSDAVSLVSFHSTVGRYAEYRIYYTVGGSGFQVYTASGINGVTTAHILFGTTTIYYWYPVITINNNTFTIGWSSLIGTSNAPGSQNYSLRFIDGINRLS